MKYSNKILAILLFQVIWVFSNNQFAQAKCDDPLSLEWLQFSIGNTCVEGIYAFEYNDDPYVYVVSKPECIAADAANTLYNCTDESFCYYFGLTLPEYQCDDSLLEAISPYLTNENLIYPLPNSSRTCQNPIQLQWVQETINTPCTDGIYTFDYNGASYIYRSTACEYVDDTNRLYNCADKSSCYVDGRTLLEDRCDLTEFPLDDFLIARNLIWSSPLLRLVPEYPWLTGKVDFNKCDDIEIKEFQTTNESYLLIKNKNLVELYAQNGSLLCSNANNTNCETAYGLTSPNETWACNPRINPTICGIDEPQDNLPWLQELIDDTPCECNASIIQYCYNGEVYFDSTPLDPGYCNDYAGFIYDVDGNVICQNGGITGGDCYQILPGFLEEAENIGTVWSCEAQNTSCETLQFASLNSGCECCNDIILFEITGGDGNYEVTTLDGDVVTNGMQTGLFSIGANELIVTDGQGCTATGIFNNFPFCCEVPPVCEGLNISYSCVNGLQINGNGGDCNSVPVKDQNGNTFYHGNLLEDGDYSFTEANEGQVSPVCTVNNVTVNCSEDMVCNMPPDSGPCEAYIPRYYYDTVAQECLQFIYGGCEGNANNYESYEVCTNSCGYNYACPFFETPLQLPWLQNIIENANGCSVNEVSQFTYNSNTYFRTSPGYSGNFCPSDLPVNYYNCDGLRLCSQGFTPYPTCNQAMVDAARETSSVIWTYSNEDCNNLQFDFIESECSACCDETLSFAISGGDGNYEVSTSDGLAIYNGMPLPLNIVYYSNTGITLIVTDGQGCTAEQDFIHYPFCCEVPPNCLIDGITYDCDEGLQINAYGDCSYYALFTDEAGNTFGPGSVLTDGNYTLISGGHPISPKCTPFELTVNCEDNMEYCDFEDVVITSDNKVCGLGIIRLTTNDVFGNEGPDDNEIVFVKVSGDNTFEVLDDTNVYDFYYCYYAVAYRSSCGAPDFNTNNFNDILYNADTYKVSRCFTVDNIQAPEYEITTEPYCDGEGKFTLGVTISGGSGSYIVGKDYTGQNVYGETGENFITFASGEEFYDIYPVDAETGCANDYVFAVTDPGCGELNICELPAVSGPCEAAIPRYYYDIEEGNCLEFTYGGCDGNANNFETYAACILACSEGNNEDCTNPFELEVVQNAIEYPLCINAIYAFEHDGLSYVYISAGCYNLDSPSLLYECNTATSCFIGGFVNTAEGCDELLEEVDYLIIDENIIWTPDEGCGCDADYTPVCGVDGNTYSNACVAECEGAEIAYEGECIVVELDCPTGDPLQWLWMQNLIVQDGGCIAYQIREFTYQGTPHYVTSPSYPSNLRCFSDESSFYYNCEGTLVCELGFFNNYCNQDILMADNDATTIWTYNDTHCADPFELEIVQQAMEDETCTGGIYAFEYNGESFIYVETLCEYIDAPNVLYNCNTGINCAIGGETIYVEACYDKFNRISDLINNDNLIWQPEEGCNCPAVYEPVCGVDGKTYGNECEATCEGVEIAYDGECDESCICPAVYEPVCGVDGNTYGNECEATCEGVEIAYEGECDESCICPAVYEPVCGVDGNTYGNECEATCEGVEIAYDGECTIELDCPTGDPLQSLWMQNLIVENGGCLISEIREFTYQRTLHYVTVPGYPSNLNCATDAPWTYYNCKGEFVCEIGFFPPDTPTFCNDDIRAAANNASVIWSYNETNCADPFELERVKNAIEDETCTEGIYAFDFEGESFIYIKTLCEFIDDSNVLYNCTTGLGCYIGGRTNYVEACYTKFDAISDLINEENLIWTLPCEYKTSAIVTEYDCGLVLETSNDLILEPSVLPDGFNLREGQTVEFTYRRVPIYSPCPTAEKAEIICIREADEGCACDDVYEPVCGVDGRTYDNPCFAECEGTEIDYEGECVEGCICPEYYQPVCGVDGRTYDNPCFAECHNIEIAYEGMCEENTAIFDKFTWLNDLVFFYGSCENEITVTEYAWSSAYSFVYIKWPDGEGQLYYQDGTYYCTDAADQSCLEIYALTNTVSSWVCNQPPSPNEEIAINYEVVNCNDDEGTFTIELSATGALSKSYGIYHSYGNGEPDFIFFKEDETINFEGNLDDAENGIFTAYIYDQYLADVAAKTFAFDVSKCLATRETNKELFNQYDWLSTLVDPNDCTPGYEITEYDFGSYSFIHIQANNEGKLYLGDGTYYCTDATDYSCVGLYGFTNPTASSSCINIMDCPDVLEPVCGVDGNTYDNACYAERAGVALANEGACTNADLFDQYPWLSTLVNPEDCDTSSRISEYDLGSYSFIFIDNDSFGSLYYQDGTYYCTDSPGYSCVELYGFPEASTDWSCDGNFIHKGEDVIANYLNFDESFKIYPNPSKGKFKVELAEPMQNLKIINMDGKVLEFLSIDNNQNLIDIDITGIAKGIYIVQLQTGDKIKTQKMIID